MLIEAILTPVGYQVVSARSGQEGIEKAREAGPDVILLDVMMSGMDGFETARRLKADPATSSVPVVMVTTLHDAPDRIKALEAGADDFLAKPVDKTELRTRVKTLAQVKAHHDHMRRYQAELEREVEAKTADLRRAAEKVRAASIETIYRLTAAAEYKDEDTGSHIVRMSRYAAAVARRMGLSSGMVEDLQAAAPMHDIGKIGIPDRILLKPGKHDPDEWEIMKRHTTIGAEILAGSDAEVIRLGETIALTHHEKWDGSGYPAGLKGTAIPVAGRIVTVADVFDALSSRRPYRPQPFFPSERVFAMVREGRGTHFDPDVVDAILSIQPEIRGIKEGVKED
jgi:putative two-component system response regulator